MEQMILRCLQKYPSDRFQDIPSLQAAFDLAKYKQQHTPSYFIAVAPTGSSDDWSTCVVDALDDKDYIKAAKIAESEYLRSQDGAALLQQLNALYRANRLFEFEEVLDRESPLLLISDGDAKAIRLLAIKVFLSLRRVDRAKILVAEACGLDGDSLELDFLSASIFGLEANFHAARETLEKINRALPSKPPVLARLIQVCEQMRDYSAAAGYLRHALRITQDTPELKSKRQHYQELGLW
jgi:serine/threonine-protein kinase